jgi:regulator of cell morphogenesis and NO signaling
MMTISERTTVAEIATAVPASVAVFHAHGIDFCCGGKRALGDVCRDQGVAFTELTRAIDAAASQTLPDHRDWQHAPLPALIDHIIETYHDRLRQDLPRLQAFAEKARHAHGSKTASFDRLAEILNELSADLLDHMRKEETVLFPAIRLLEAGDARQGTWISAPVSILEEEHDRAGDLLAQLRLTTDGYVPPEWACATVRALYQGLAQLEHEMHVHVHLENNILFARAVRSQPPAAGAGVDVLAS